MAFCPLYDELMDWCLSRRGGKVLTCVSPAPAEPGSVVTLSPCPECRRAAAAKKRAAYTIHDFWREHEERKKAKKQKEEPAKLIELLESWGRKELVQKEEPAKSNELMVNWGRGKLVQKSRLAKLQDIIEEK